MGGRFYPKKLNPLTSANWADDMTWELRHHFRAAAILVQDLGFLDFSKSPQNGQN